MKLRAVVEAIIFAAPEPIGEDEIYEVIKKVDTHISQDEVIQCIQDLMTDCQSDVRGIELNKSGMGYSFVTKKITYPYILKYIERIQKKRLSRSALETLSIIAFNQDCTKTDIEQIRGVSADYAVDKLLERELIEISGRKDTLGQPMTYKTTEKFLNYFGLMSIDDLPEVKIENENNNEIGSEMEE